MRPKRTLTTQINTFECKMRFSLEMAKSEFNKEQLKLRLNKLKITSENVDYNLF